MLYILPHLGLGDAIIYNGLVRELATRHDRVTVPFKWHNQASVEWMWQDVDNIVPLGVRDDAEAKHWAGRFKQGRSPVLRLGLHSHEPLEAQWDRQCYRQAHVGFGARWTEFKLPPMPAACSRPQPFLHDDPARGYRIDRRRVPPDALAVEQLPNLFNALPWLQQASEVHVIDSVFLCLADSVPTVGRLVFHRYARPNGQPPTLRKNWEVLT